MGGLKLQDLNWGMLNEISDTRQGQLTGDRRRTSTSTMLRRFATDAYTPDTVGARKEYQGFVVSHRPINYATYQNPGSMLQEYAILSNFAGPAGNDSAHQEAGRYNNLAYKVYIPELEPRPAPRGHNDPVLRTYPDVFSALPSKEALPLGTLVAVRYENPQHLTRPKIVRVIDYGIGIENISVNEEGRVLANAFYQGRIPGTLGAAAPMPAGVVPASVPLAAQSTSTGNRVFKFSVAKNPVIVFFWPGVGDGTQPFVAEEISKVAPPTNMVVVLAKDRGTDYNSLGEDAGKILRDLYGDETPEYTLRLGAWSGGSRGLATALQSPPSTSTSTAGTQGTTMVVYADPSPTPLLGHVLTGTGAGVQVRMIYGPHNWTGDYAHLGEKQKTLAIEVAQDAPHASVELDPTTPGGHKHILRRALKEIMAT